MEDVPTARRSSADFTRALPDVPSLAAFRDRRRPADDAETSGAASSARAAGADATSAASGLLALRERLAAATTPGRIGAPLDEEALDALRQVVDSSDAAAAL